MRTAAALFSLIILAITSTSDMAGQARMAEAVPGAANTHFTLHNILPAHEITLGAGARVGILASSFEAEAHPKLYQGGKDFLNGDPLPDTGKGTHHGYWMALALNEIAPEAEIFALETHSQDEAAQVDAMVRALDWAVEQKLDVVTYCGRSLSARARETLDPVVERTVKAGVVVVFLGYSHPLNLLPGGFGLPSESGLRDPDLSIFSYDCSTLLTDSFVTLMESDDDQIQRHRPFLTRPSAGPITAGLVALLRSVNPEVTPDEIKRILIKTSRDMEFQGRLAANVPDAYEAVSRVSGV